MKFVFQQVRATHHAPQQGVLVVGHDQDDVAEFAARLRALDAAGEQREEQRDGCAALSRGARRTFHRGLWSTGTGTLT